MQSHDITDAPHTTKDCPLNFVSTVAPPHHPTKQGPIHMWPANRLINPTRAHVPLWICHLLGCSAPTKTYFIPPSPNSLTDTLPDLCPSWDSPKKNRLPLLAPRIPPSPPPSRKKLKNIYRNIHKRKLKIEPKRLQRALCVFLRETAPNPN